MKFCSYLVSLIFFLFIFVAPALAHDASLTYTSITLSDKNITLILTTPYNNILKSLPDHQADITSLDPRFFQKQFAQGFLILNNGHSCTPYLRTVKQIKDIKAFQYTFIFTCGQELGQVRLIDKLFFSISPTHENITDIHSGNDVQKLIFSSTLHEVEVDYQQARATQTSAATLLTIFTFLKIGILHILAGYDHILFLLGLLIVTKRFKNILKIITSFTLAHSLTLTIAALGIFLLPSRLTESLIALSIAYVAIENVLMIARHETKQWYTKLFLADVSKRWLVALFFGLIHGFGFSSALREIGIPSNELVTSLISFNVGVEFGQLLIIATLLPLLWFVRKKHWDNNVIKVVSIIIGIVGLIWFVQRAFFS